jgi:DNA-binding MarR family transcriptional regulator
MDMPQRDAEAPTIERDRVDERIEHWANEIPGLDLATEAITQRVHMLHRGFEIGIAETSERFGLTAGEYAVLARLRGAGEPYRMSPSRLAESCILSSGAMTNRLDNLEEARLVKRVPDPADRRSVQVELTAKGRRVWDEMATLAAAREAQVTEPLDDDEKEQLNALLRRLVLSYEGQFGRIKK